MPVDPTIVIRRRDSIRRLDPRLALLHWFGETRTNAIRDGERRRVEEIEAVLNAPFPLHTTSAAHAERIEVRAREVRDLMFSPVTTGVIPLPARDCVKATGKDATETMLSVLVLGDLGAEDLRNLGCVPRTKVGDVFTAWVPWSRLPDLASAAGVRCVELARAFRPSLGTAIPATGIQDLHDQVHSGAGVIVGIVDQVLDFHHPAFCSGTNSRVLFLWDQTVDANLASGEAAPPATASGPGGDVELTGLGYGVEYPQAKISQQVAQLAANPAALPYDIVRHKPPTSAGSVDGHGTFVAGIAAGNGAGYVPLLPGAAPGADIVFVHFESESVHLPLAESTYVLHAFQYIFGRATALGKACVVNFSYNDAQGAHDGSSVLETALDLLLNQSGRAITISAGNDNKQDWHAAGVLTASGGAFEAELPLYVAINATVPEEAQVWFAESHAFQFALDFRPTGGTRTTLIDWMNADEMVEWDSSGADSQPLVETVLVDPRNGHSMVELLLVPKAAKSLEKGTYFLRLKSAAPLMFQAWVSASNTATYWKASVVQDKLTIGLPATARRVFGIAEHDNVDVGRVVDPASGRGPTRDGGHQPVLAAPGGLFAPRPTSREQFKIPPQLYAGFSGTSAAAPLVAGTCALIFDCLGADTDLKMLRTTLLEGAGRPAGTTWNKDWGYGYLQASLACAAQIVFPPQVDWELLVEPFHERIPRIITQMTPLDSERSVYASEIELVGTGRDDTVEIRARKGCSVEIELPSLCLPWRRARELEELRRTQSERPLYGASSTRDPFVSIEATLGAREAAERLDVQGVLDAAIQGGRARLRGRPGARIFIEKLRLAKGASVKARVTVRGAAGVTQQNLVRVAQFSEGAWQRCFVLRPSAPS